MSSFSTVACQWQITAGNIDNFTLAKDVPIGSLAEATGATSSVSVSDQQGSAPSSSTTVPLATIAVKYVGLNFADMFACLGLYSATPKGTFVPGLEFSGIIEAVNELAGAPLDDDGSSSSSSGIEFLGDSSGRGYKVGDAVFGVTRFGGYTTRLHADTRYVRRLPKGYSLAHGAALPAQALTAWYGLVELGGMGTGVPRPLALSEWRRQCSSSESTAADEPSSTSASSLPERFPAAAFPFISKLDKIKAAKPKVALIHSGGGGTGLWCIHICRYFNIDVVTTVGSAKKKVELMKMFGPQASPTAESSSTTPSSSRLASDGLPTTSCFAVIDRSSCDYSDATRRAAITDALKEIAAQRGELREKRRSGSNKQPNTATAASSDDACIHNATAEPSSPASASSSSSSESLLGFDYVFDSLQGPWFQPSYDFMRPQGRHLVLGAGSMTPQGATVNWLKMAWQYVRRPSVDPLTIMSVNKSVMGFNLIWLFDNVDEVGEFLTSVVEMIQFSTASPKAATASAEGEKQQQQQQIPLLPTIGRQYDSFADLPKALREFQSGTTMGKVVVSTAM